MRGEENKTEAREKLIDIVQDSGEIGFMNLVRALVRNEQVKLAEQLDEDLANEFVVRRPAVAGE